METTERKGGKIMIPKIGYVKAKLAIKHDA
jgi:hypothetical protein